MIMIKDIDDFFKTIQDEPLNKCKNCCFAVKRDFDCAGIYIQNATICTLKRILIALNKVKVDHRIEMTMSEDDKCDLIKFIKEHAVEQK